MRKESCVNCVSTFCRCVKHADLLTEESVCVCESVSATRVHAVKPVLGVRCLPAWMRRPSWWRESAGRSAQRHYSGISAEVQMISRLFSAADSNFRAVTWECAFFSQRSDEHTLTLQNGGHRIFIAPIRLSQPQQPHSHRSDLTSSCAET